MNYFQYMVQWSPTLVYIAMCAGGVYLFIWILLNQEKVCKINFRKMEK